MLLATGVITVVIKSPGHDTGLCHTGHRQNSEKLLAFFFFFSPVLTVPFQLIVPMHFFVVGV